MTIHWCGTGLSAIPGLRRLIEGGHKVTVWNRTIEKAKAEVGDLTDDIRAFDIDALGEVLGKGDVIVSMLPGDWHVFRWQSWRSRNRPISSHLRISRPRCVRWTTRRARPVWRWSTRSDWTRASTT